ncbi:excisionase family DNA-binding protein [Roseiconus lacunae]|uniref:excisionase family DNA-binding protein n=1 Tax=Roseiconus lacunae TaxID=2605694 RepID=UPI003090AB30|nr:excisionase family DNA-binding protein [Stieleria sp. HD01]
MLTIDERLVDEIAERIAKKLRNEQRFDFSPAKFQKVLVDAGELARAISLSRPTIDRLVSRDKIPSVKVGGRRLFSIEEVVGSLKKASLN